MDTDAKFLYDVIVRVGEISEPELWASFGHWDAIRLHTAASKLEEMGAIRVYRSGPPPTIYVVNPAVAGPDA